MKKSLLLKGFLLIGIPIIFCFSFFKIHYLDVGLYSGETIPSSIDEEDYRETSLQTQKSLQRAIDSSFPNTESSYSLKEDFINNQILGSTFPLLKGTEKLFKVKYTNNVEFPLGTRGEVQKLDHLLLKENPNAGAGNVFLYFENKDALQLYARHGESIYAYLSLDEFKSFKKVDIYTQEFNSPNLIPGNQRVDNSKSKLEISLTLEAKIFITLIVFFGWFIIYFTLLKVITYLARKESDLTDIFFES